MHVGCPHSGGYSDQSSFRCWPGRAAGGRNRCPPTRDDPQLTPANVSFGGVETSLISTSHASSWVLVQYCSGDATASKYEVGGAPNCRWNIVEKAVGLL